MAVKAPVGGRPPAAGPLKSSGRVAPAAPGKACPLALPPAPAAAATSCSPAASGRCAGSAGMAAGGAGGGPWGRRVGGMVRECCWRGNPERCTSRGTGGVGAPVGPLGVPVGGPSAPSGTGDRPGPAVMVDAAECPHQAVPAHAEGLPPGRPGEQARVAAAETAVHSTQVKLAPLG